MLKPNAVKSFQEYAEEVFVKFIQWQLQSLKRIDIVWDRYSANSIKGSVREKRSVGVDGKLVPNQRFLPTGLTSYEIQIIRLNRLHFFTKVADGKLVPNQRFLPTGLTSYEIQIIRLNRLHFFTKVASEKLSLEGKEIYITSDQSVVSLFPSTSMPDCTHEESDTWIVVRIIDAIRKGMKSICIRTVDTDILTIHISKFHFLKDLCKDLERKVAFGVRKNFVVYSVNNICSTFGLDKSKIMSIFHTFSGCDTTSSFHGRGRKVHGNLGCHFQR